MKKPEIMKNRLMKKDLFTVKKGPRIAARVSSCTGHAPPVGPWAWPVWCSTTRTVKATLRLSR